MMLLDNAHTTDQINLKKINSYILVVTRAEVEEQITVLGSAEIGAKACIIEQYLVEDNYLHTKYVPSKALICIARAAKDTKDYK